MTREHGTAMFEVIVMGFAIVMLVLIGVSTVARFAEATASVHSVARDGAVWMARHGQEPPPTDGVTISIVRRSAYVEVTATRQVFLMGVGDAAISTTVSSSVQVPISEYRSQR